MPPPLVPSAWIEEKRIEAMYGTRVLEIEPGSGLVRLEGGSHVQVDRMILTTGARARRPQLPGINLDGVFTLRTLDDARRLQRECRPGNSLVVIGGGLIGCEVATTARRLGLEVTVLEAADELLLRVLGRRMGSWCRTRLEALGVKVMLNTQALSILGERRVGSVACSDGRAIPADLVLISIGAEPAVELAAAAGIPCGRGILVDASGATEAERVFSAGDAASWPLRDGQRRSLETYLNSQAQAAAAAAAMMGRPQPAPQESISWTEIAGHRLQMAGSIDGPGEIVERGVVDREPALIFRLLEGKIVGAVAIDSQKDFSQAARMVAKRTSAIAEVLADGGVDLRELLRK